MSDRAAHTPGPWLIREGFRSETWDVYPHRGGPPKFGQWAEIATVENRNDARLMAAAPDLLANAYAADTCLSVAWGYARELGKHEEANHILEVQQSVRAAIAAATGEKHEQ